LIDADTIARIRGNLGLKWVGGSIAGPVVLPAWSPRMPIGIWSYGSKVSIRNVTIQALK